MKIIEQYSNIQSDNLEIENAKYLGNHVVHVVFKDGKEQYIDFKPFLNKSQHLSIIKYLDETLFSNFSIVDGNLNWNDYDLIFPIWDLYHEKI